MNPWSFAHPAGKICQKWPVRYAKIVRTFSWQKPATRLIAKDLNLCRGCAWNMAAEAAESVTKTHSISIIIIHHASPPPKNKPRCYPQQPRNLSRNLPGTRGSEPSRNPWFGSRPGTYIGKDPIAKAVGEKHIYIHRHPRKLAGLAGKTTMNEDVSPI